MKELCIHGRAARLECAAQNDERVNPTCRVHKLLHSYRAACLSLTMFATIGQVLAAEEAEEAQGTLEVGVEDRRQTRVPVLCPLFLGRREAEAVVHRARAEVPLFPMRLVRREAEAVLPQP